MTTFPHLPPVGPLALLRALFKDTRTAGEPSEIATTFLLERIDAGQLERYNKLLGFAPDALPISFYYLPVQRAHLATMLEGTFPFRLAGMIHVENDISELRQPDRSQPMELATRVVIEPPTSAGARYCELQTVGTQQGQAVFECRSRYLAGRAKKRRAEGNGRGRGGRLSQAAGHAAGEWILAANAGRQYASVSGDWNPIHLWPWTARLLGMKAPIIHGMHTVAKACALLERTEGRRVTAISARFKAPIPLGSRGELRLSAPGTYQVFTDGGMAVDGNWR